MTNDNMYSRILTISMGFLALHLLFSWKWAAVVSLAVGVVGLTSLFLGRKIEWAWMKLTELLGHVVPKILLGIVYYLILFPLSALARLFNKDSLMLSGDHKSYFVDVEKSRVFDKTYFERPW